MKIQCNEMQTSLSGLEARTTSIINEKQELDRPQHRSLGGTRTYGVTAFSNLPKRRL